MTNHVFISYSAADGLGFATKLADELQGRHPFIKVWFDKRELDASIVDWDDQLANAIKGCKCLVFVMTPDSTAKGSTCKEEWTWALKYKKPVICLLKDKKAEVPFRLNNRQYIDISTNFDSGIAQLRSAFQRLDEPEGILEELDRRLSQAKRDLQRTPHEAEKPRIQAEIEDLNKQIEAQQKVVNDPEGAKKQTEQNIQTGLERERQPEKPVAAQTSTKFINPPPGIAPTYFQDRSVETEQIVRFLQDDSQRMMTIVGRGGVGKTAMVCRLLKGLEGGELPDGLGSMRVEGIVYLSESGSHRVNFANLFYDLCKLLPADAANALDAVYKNPQASTASKMSALLDRFTAGKVVLLLDNVEPLISVETFDIADAELDECLRALLHGAYSALKVILTTRVAPRGLNLCEPGRQRVLTLDSGLEQKYAVEMLREMDVDGKLGLKSADAEALKRAYERTLGFPRALEALFAILASDRYTTLEELLAMPTPVNVVEALVGEAFNRLDTNAQKVMQALAVYNRPVTPAAVDYLLAPHLPAMDSAPILQRLANMHFARKESGRFYLHPVDREFAFGLIPEKDLTTKVTKDFEEEEEEDSVIKVEPDDVILASDETEDDSSDDTDIDFESLFVSWRASQYSAFTQHDLTLKAADYFAQARKPRAEWKKLEDLSAQLAEFDLRCAAGDYDTAASVLLEIDHYLNLWGHYKLQIRNYEITIEKVSDPKIAINSIGNLGWFLYCIGQIQEAIKCYEKSIQMSKETKDLQAESAWLGNIGSAHLSLGDVKRATSYLEKSLEIDQDLGDKKAETTTLNWLGNCCSSIGQFEQALKYYIKALDIAEEIQDKEEKIWPTGNIGECYKMQGNFILALDYHKKTMKMCCDLGERRGEIQTLDRMGNIYVIVEDYEKANENYYQAIQIADEISFPAIQHSARNGLAEAYLSQNDLVNARSTIEDAMQYDVPENNHNASALHGIIALRQGDASAARGAFVRAIGQADEILSKTAEYYSALDAKGLSICGLAICDGNGKGGQPSALTDDAITTFNKARQIAPHAGVVKSVLRLFDELAKCDTEGFLKDVRKAAAGKE